MPASPAEPTSPSCYGANWNSLATLGNAYDIMEMSNESKR
jgi:hypothetical protein